MIDSGTPAFFLWSADDNRVTSNRYRLAKTITSISIGGLDVCDLRKLAGSIPFEYIDRA